MSIINTPSLADSGQFPGILLTFWGPGVISMINDSRGAFTCRSSTLTVLSILARFMIYYSLFWCPGVISTINESRGAFTCRSLTITALVTLARFVDYY